MCREENPLRDRLIGRAMFLEDMAEVKTPELLRAAADRIRHLEFTETQQRERFEEEVWSAHKWLDDRGIPRADVGGEVFSLVGRMMRLMEDRNGARA